MKKTNIQEDAVSKAVPRTGKRIAGKHPGGKVIYESRKIYKRCRSKEQFRRELSMLL